MIPAFLISKKQIKAFERLPDLKSFEHQMFSHIAEHFPVHAGLLGRAGLSKVIILGIAKAKQYGFSTRYEVCLFIDMMIMLGSEFDTDIQLPFVSRLLNEQPSQEQLQKIEIVYKASIAHIEKTLGKEEVFPINALSKIRDLDLNELEKRLSVNFRQSLEEELKVLWPEKCIDHHKNIVSNLIDQGIAKANSYGFSKPLHNAYFVMFMFVMGHEFDKDPLYPWVEKVLNDPELTDEEDKFSRLHFTANAILKKAL